jgi:bacterioferritin-associated ferredoxin
VTSDDVGMAMDNGAATVAAVARATGACTRCGICKDRIRAMLGERSSSVTAPSPRVVASAQVTAV